MLEDILAENDRIAEANRADLLAAGVRTVNLMSAPGAGKTTLLRRTLEALHPHLRLGVLEGDIATSIDADRLEGLGAAVALVNTSAGFEANVTSTPSWCASVCAACRSTTSTCCSSRTSATWLRGVAAPMITRGADQP